MLSMNKNTLDVEKISELRRTIEKKNSIFADMRYLDNLFLPSEIIGRFQESEELLKILMGFDKGLPVPFVSVYGRSGSGKSTVTKFVCQEISDVVELCFVNLRKTRTIFGCANTINSELGGEIKKSQGLDAVINSIQNLICNSLRKNSKRHFVLVLDEFDVIFSDRRGNPSDNPESWAEKMIYLLNDEKKSQNMGLAGRKKVEANYSIVSVTNEISKMYDSIIGK